MQKKYSLQIILLFIIFISQLSFPQVVYTPSDHYVYEFLERLSLKNVIEYHNEVKPISRKKIADLLVQASLKKEKLNPVELKELDWLFEEYANEIGDASGERWYLYSYSDSILSAGLDAGKSGLSLRISPTFGYSITSIGKYSGHSRWWGGNMFSTYSDWFGASFSVRDRGEFGSNVERVKNFSTQTGYSYIPVENGIESSDIRGSISFNWNWGHVSLIKDQVEWGNGKFGQLILSEKAPPFTFIRLDLHPLEWLRFYYLHGWLNSLVYDSSRFSYNHTGSINPYLRKESINKYIAANFLSVSIFSWFDLSFGNSIVYSGQLAPEFFIPFMFLKRSDSKLEGVNSEDGNKQLYIDASIKYPESFLFYSTLFADCIEIRKLLKNDFRGTDLGFTVGGKKIDLFLPLLDLTLEYTRSNPWIYEHQDETTTYKHLNYYLGHWLGQNADQFRVQLDYRPIRGLKLKVYSEFIRKGGLYDIYYRYYNQISIPFLSSPVRRETHLSFEASYEILHDLFVDTFYSYSNITDEDPTRTPVFLLGKKHSFGLTLHYGL